MSYNIVKFGPITASSSLNVSGNTTLPVELEVNVTYNNIGTITLQNMSHIMIEKIA